MNSVYLLTRRACGLAALSFDNPNIVGHMLSYSIGDRAFLQKFR